MNDVFICYSPEDESVASDICTLLEDNDYKCWYKKRDFGEDDSVIKITEAIRDSRGFLLIYSKDAKESNFVTTEVDIAFSSDVPILVFSVDDSAVEGKLQFYLKDKPKINAYPNAEDYYDELLKDTNEYLGVVGDNTEVITPSGGNDAYICYADEDVLTAEAIAHVLEKNGIKCWFKNRDLKVSETVQKISETIKDSKSFILVYSNSASESNFVKTDTELALSANVPILSFKIDDVEKSEELASSHWLDAYPNPEENFRDLVIDTGKLIGKPVDNPEITKEYSDLKKVEKTEKKVEYKPVTKVEESSKGFADKLKENKFILIAVVVVILAIAAGFAYYSSSTSTSTDSAVNIPNGFYEVPDYAYSDSEEGVSYDYKFYQNDNMDFFDVYVVRCDSGAFTPSQDPGEVKKTINGVEGIYNSNDTEFEFVNSKGNLITVSASDEKLLEEIIK